MRNEFVKKFVKRYVGKVAVQEERRKFITRRVLQKNEQEI